MLFNHFLTQERLLAEPCRSTIAVPARTRAEAARRRQNTFFLSVRARTENTSVKNDSLSAASLSPQERRWGVRKWLKSIGFLWPPVISHKMSACMRMAVSLTLTPSAPTARPQLPFPLQQMRTSYVNCTPGQSRGSAGAGVWLSTGTTTTITAGRKPTRQRTSAFRFP